MPHAVPPRKAPNITRRSREYLTPREVDAPIATARRLGRYGHRDATMLLLAYRHGLRVSELVALRWEQVDMQGGVLHVRRRKNGLATTHPLYGPEIRALRVLARAYPGMPYVFVSERQGPLTDATVRKIVARAGEATHLGFPVHPHMLRHAMGFTLANEGHDTRIIQHYLGFCRKFRFWGKIRKSGINNSMTYRPQNSRKSKFATEPLYVPVPV